MTSVTVKMKLVEISNVIKENVDEISYIRYENNNYIIGTKKYSEKIAEYLDENVKNWNCMEENLASLKKKRGSNKLKKGENDVYLWIIPLTENNFL